MEHENKHGQPIVGSAESLTPEETRDRLRELEAWGVDLSLVRASLERTPTKRVTRMIGSLELAMKLRQAYASQVS